MPRDFRSFAEENKKVLETNKEEANKVEDLINKYKGMSNNQLMTNLLEEASKLKREGKLDATQLESMKGTLAPFLNAEQQSMLDELVRAINEQK